MYQYLCGSAPVRAGLLLACFGAAGAGFSQTSYIWTGATSTDYQLSSNWGPARITPAATDVLHFSGGGAVTVTNVATQSVGELHVTNNTAVTWSVPAARTLTVAGGASAVDFEVAAGSSLKW